ncbi:MAG: FkbM family methyltransferase [Gemmataceae bacterium]|nr:FkbM family methyltransferase [Gemmataceae bacterium]
MAEQVAQLQAQELALFAGLRQVVQPPVMIDVGAHHGVTLAPFLEAGWQVFAFEPVEENRAEIQRRFGTHPRLQVRGEAVSDSCGPKVLHLALHPDGRLHDYHHSLEQLGHTEEFRPGPSVTVSAVTLDALVARGALPREVGLLKIDTEGHDLAVLRGAETLQAAVITVEFWCEGLYGGRCPSPVEEIVRLLQQRGYHHYAAIIHQGASVRVQWSSLEGLPADAWGNLVFFREEAVAWAVRQKLELKAQSAAHGEETPRWLALCAPWLQHRSGWICYDVGAYQGDFTALLLRHFPHLFVAAFEPTPPTFRYLERRFAEEPRVQVHNLALSDQTGWASYYLTERPVNNSLLPPADGAVLETIRVAVDKLDQFRRRDCRPVALLKVDAQGHDLRILRGAEQILQQDRPWLFVEATFLPMYQQQDDPCDLWLFLREHGYRLAGLYNTHSTPQGLLAYTDCLFIPQEIHQRLVPAQRLERYLCDDPQTLQQQNALLQAACQERLELIHRLSAECAQREQIIARLSQPSPAQALRGLVRSVLSRLDQAGRWVWERLRHVSRGRSAS